jgi:hypothetical protein
MVQREPCDLESRTDGQVRPFQLELEPRHKIRATFAHLQRQVLNRPEAKTECVSTLGSRESNTLELSMEAVVSA